MATPNPLPTTIPLAGNDQYKESTTRIMVHLIELLYPFISEPLATRAAYIDGHISQFREDLSESVELKRAQVDIENLMDILRNTEAPISNFMEKLADIVNSINLIDTKEDTLTQEIDNTKESMDRKLQEENKQCENGKNKKEGGDLLKQETSSIKSNKNQIEQFSNDNASLGTKQYELHNNLYKVYITLSESQKNRNQAAPVPQAPRSR